MAAAKGRSAGAWRDCGGMIGGILQWGRQKQARGRAGLAKRKTVVCVFAKEKFRGMMEISGRRGRFGVTTSFPPASENRRRRTPCRAFASCLVVLGSGKNKAPSITLIQEAGGLG